MRLALVLLTKAQRHRLRVTATAKAVEGPKSTRTVKLRS